MGSVAEPRLSSRTCQDPASLRIPIQEQFGRPRLHRRGKETHGGIRSSRLASGTAREGIPLRSPQGAAERVKRPTPVARVRRPRTGALSEALEAVRQDRGDLLVAALDGVEIRRDARASATKRFLTGEMAFRESDYPDALEHFGAWESSPIRERPEWMGVLSSLRRALAHLRLGNYREARACLREAVTRAATGSDLAIWQSDLDALRGFLADFVDDRAASVAHFTAAYRHAMRDQRWPTAVIVAAELTRLHVGMNDLDTARRWTEGTQKALAHAEDHRLIAFLWLSRAMVLAPMGQAVASERLLTKVIDAGELPEFLAETRAEALMRRAELRCQLRKYSEAERDLEQALKAARVHRLPRFQAQGEWNYAVTCRLRKEPSDLRDARAHFGKAFDILSRSSPPFRPLLRQMAENILLFPWFVGRDDLPRKVRRELADLLDQIQRLETSQVLHRTCRVFEIGALHDRLLLTLRLLITPPIDLSRTTVFTQAGSRPKAGDGAPDLGDALAEVLMVLRDQRGRALTANDVVEILGHPSREAVAKSLQRLVKKYPDEVKAEGRVPRRYWVVRSESAGAAGGVTDGSSGGF